MLPGLCTLGSCYFVNFEFSYLSEQEALGTEYSFLGYIRGLTTDLDLESAECYDCVQ